jgi:hypothetical protein
VRLISAASTVVLPAGVRPSRGGPRDLPAVLDHYNELFDLSLTATEKADLVEFLKSL